MEWRFVTFGGKLCEVESHWGQFLYRDMALKLMINLNRIFKETMAKSKDYQIKLHRGLH